MASFAHSVLVLSLLVVAVYANRQVRQLPTVTTTKVITVSTTTTATIPTTTVCVSFVNATSSCRRRRNFWIDVPVILSLDDDISDILEPSAVVRVRTTALPTNSHLFRTGSTSAKDSADAPSTAAAESAIASSINTPDSPDGTDDFRVAEPIYFAQLAQFISTALNLASTSTVSSTTTRTSTAFAFTTTSTKTLIVSGCIPSLTISKC